MRYKPTYIHLLSLIVVSMCLYTCEHGSGQPNSLTYEITITSLWSTINHPTSFPTGKNPYFSKVMGMTHNNTASLFTLGKSAAEGVNTMATDGVQETLEKELQALKTAGSVDTIIKGANTIPPAGSLTLEVEVHKNHSLVSLISMINPSPDWFVAIKDVSLFNTERNKWIYDKKIDLIAYDAGVIEGIDYTEAIRKEESTITLINKPPLANQRTGLVKRIGYVTFKVK